MFDFSMSEIAVFGVVALLAIGPKDMPVAMRAVARTLKKARKMAAEFQGHVDDMMRDANLGEVSEHLRDIRNFDIGGGVRKFVDPNNDLGKVVADVNVAARSEPIITRPDEADVITLPEEEPKPDAPDFVPPACARVKAPAFVPPAAARRGY
jgi:sec-independent protein translocase protein TatB